MRESAQCHVTLRIDASEEVGLMELLKFMYSNSLTVTTAPAVLDVLTVADKFDVASCMRHCSRLLRNQPEFDVFDHGMVVMDSPEDGCDHDDLGITFNDSNFFDRVLRIYIFSESTQSTSEARVKTLYVSSAILAARSPFFYKLFLKSAPCHATLQIKASEEAGLMELLKFMYSNSLTVTSGPGVLDVLMTAHKFDVASCMRHCSRLLSNPLIMTPKFALVYLELPSTILMAEALRPLTTAVKQFFALHYKDITRFEDEILSLPVACVEALIASDDLQVVSEDAVYHFVLKWVRAHYPKIEDRREIIETRFGKFMRYSYMTYEGLYDIMCSKESSRRFALCAVSEAVVFKDNEIPQYIIKDDKETYRRFVERKAYQHQQELLCNIWSTLCYLSLFTNYVIYKIIG